MGISTVQSYIGAQIFEVLGISHDVIDRYFPNTSSKLSGLTIEDLAKEVRLRHEAAFQSKEAVLETGSDFQWRYGESLIYSNRKPFIYYSMLFVQENMKSIRNIAIC